MAHTITGASLQGIYDRLNSAPRYKPMEANTFSDWSVEAGDTVTVSREGTETETPVFSSSMMWRKGQQVSLSSTGNRQRDAVSKVSKNKYNSGSSGIRNSQKMYIYEVNQQHLLYEVYDSEGRLSTLEVTVHGLFHEVYDTDGRFSTLKNTVDGLFHEVYDTNGRFSTLKNTVDGLFHEVYDTNGRFSTLKNTVDGLFHEVYDTDGRFSTLKNTVDGLFHEVYDTDGRFSRLQNTADGLYHEVYDTNGRFSLLKNTVDGLYHEVYDTNGRFSVLKNTTDGLYHEVYDTDGSFAALSATVAGLSYEVYDADGAVGQLQQTATSFSTRISKVVSNTTPPRILAAEIATAINENGSEAYINADHIYLTGTTTLSGTFEISEGNLYVKKAALFQGTSGNVMISNGAISSSRYVVNSGGSVQFIGGQVGEQYSLTGSDVSGMIIKAEVDPVGNILKLWKKGDNTSGDPSITFRKSTSISGSWSGSTYTAAYDPNGTPTASTTILQQASGTTQYSNFSVMYGEYTSGGNFVQHGDTMRIALEQATDILGNNYIDAVVNDTTHVARIAISGSIETVTLTGGWSNSVYQVVAKDQDNVTIATHSYDPLMELQGTTQYSNFTAAIYTVDANLNHSTQKSVGGWLILTENGASSYVDVNTNSAGTGTNVARLSVGGLYTGGQNSVTINKQPWNNGQAQFTKSAGTGTSRGVLVGLDGSWGTGENANKYLYTIKDYYDDQQGVSTGYTGAIDASGIYSDGQANGRNGVEIVKSSWANGTVQFTKSAGTGTSRGVQVGLDGNWGSGEDLNKYVYTIKDYYDNQQGVSTGYTGKIDASSIYSNGQINGRNGVEIVKGQWSGGIVQFSKSAGAGTSRGVQVGLGGNWGTGGTANVYSYTINDYYDNPQGVSTGYTGTIDASGRYNAGWSDAYNKISLHLGEEQTSSPYYNITVPKSAPGSDGVDTATYGVTADNDYVYLMNVGGNVVLARNTNPGYANGYNQAWATAYGKISLHLGEEQTSSPYYSITVPKSTPGSDGVDTAVYGITADNNYVYLVNVAGGVILARNTNPAFANGYNQAWDTAYGIMAYLPEPLAAGETRTSFYVRQPGQAASTYINKVVELSQGTPAKNGYAAIVVKDYGATNGNVYARVSIGEWYRAGWDAAHDSERWPTQDTSSGTTNKFKVYRASSTVDGDVATRDYYLGAEANLITDSQGRKCVRAYVYYNTTSNRVATLDRIVSLSDVSSGNLSITRTVAGRDSSGNNTYYGILYYWDADSGSYEKAYPSNCYWYRSGTSKTGTTTVYY